MLVETEHLCEPPYVPPMLRDYGASGILQGTVKVHRAGPYRKFLSHMIIVPKAKKVDAGCAREARDNVSIPKKSCRFKRQKSWESGSGEDRACTARSLEVRGSFLCYFVL